MLWYPCICISPLFVYHLSASLAIASSCPFPVHAKFLKASNKALSSSFLLPKDPVSHSPFLIEQKKFTGHWRSEPTIQSQDYPLRYKGVLHNIAKPPGLDRINPPICHFRRILKRQAHRKRKRNLTTKRT